MNTQVIHDFGRISLEDLRQRSLDAPGGVAFVSLRADDRELFLVACLTDPDLMSSLEATPDSSLSNWRTFLLSDLFARYAFVDRLTTHVLLSSNSCISALALTAATPCTIANLRTLFRFPA